MKKIISFLLTAAAFVSLCGCSGGAPENRVFSVDDLHGKQAGIVVDTPTYCCLADYEEMGINLRSYTDSGIIIKDVESGSLDCAIMDEYLARDELSVFSSAKILEPPILEADYSIITALESASLLSVIDSNVSALIEDGTVKAITDNYSGGKEYIYTSPTDVQYDGVLTLAVNAIGKPFAYYDEVGVLTGMDIDIARAVCDRMGVELKIVDAEEADLYGFIRSGKADLAMGCLTKNEETQELVGFSQPYYTCTQVIIVRKK